MATRATCTDPVVDPGWAGRLADAEAHVPSTPVERRRRFASGRVLARWRAFVAARRAYGATGLPGGEQRNPVDRGAAAIAVCHAFR